MQTFTKIALEAFPYFFDIATACQSASSGPLFLSHQYSPSKAC